MDDKLKQIVDGATREKLERLALQDALIDSFRVTAAGVDVTQWGPNGGKSRPQRDREKQHLLAELAKSERRGGEIPPDEAAELRRLIKRILR